MSSNVPDSGDYVGPGILDITLKSDKPFNSAKVKISTTTGYVIYREKKTPGASEVTFRAPSELSLVAGLTLQITYSHPFMVKTPISIAGEDLLSVYKPGGPEDNQTVWKGYYGKVEVLVVLEDPLHPTTDRILEICPRFRILVIGKSGVGKSSLINKAFGVTDAHESPVLPGEADIDREISIKDNPQFVLHDSLGFEQGENIHFKIVQDFIKRREQEPEIKNKLHAVWLCLQSPALNGRFTETGAENFLKLKAEGKLGDVPIIVVFTKYDRVVDAKRMELVKAGRPSSIEEATKNAKEKLLQDCITPLKRAVRGDIPYVLVSIRPTYTEILSELIKVTYDNVGKYISEAAIVTGISQRINAQVKIRASIEVGKRKHWRGLTSDAAMPGTLGGFLNVIHHDIIRVWNMDDDQNLLCSPEFKALMLNSVDSRAPNADKIFIIPAAICDAVARIVEVLTGPAGPIVVPFVMLGFTWVNEQYRKTHINLRRIIVYIVNLTIVMQNLFWIQSILATRPRPGGNSRVSDRVIVPIKRRFIKLAFNVYITAADRDELLDQIHNHTKKVKFVFQVLLRDGHDETINKIVRLIDSSTISNSDAFTKRNGVEFNGSWEGDEDEEWNLKPSDPD
ncbi:hypothetical protein BDZ94DRAFT_1264780 [Collybia nuda]|uniref:G domain-containing protein n=1 Tax=Collybia nuda TaxID=64659 RepID=A0A9P6CHH5_9AGAR|nr:hypothetical protein BDZ94DRAFT_1264780 [Collybia nuda]